MLSKLFTSEVAELMRSQIAPSSYNPRTITDEGRRQLKKSLRTYGVVGGIVVNKRTGYTIVGGHQKVYIMDEIQKYNRETQENDYKMRVEVIDVDEKKEKELNIVLNNPNVGGDWDYDRLRELIPDIDYKNAGLTDEDLSLIGIDFTMQTEDESFLANALDELSAPIDEKRQTQKELRAAERAEMSQEEKTAAVKDMKRQIMEKAEEKAENMESYVMVNFDTAKAKADFMLRFGHSAHDKFMKGEYLVKLIDELS